MCGVLMMGNYETTLTPKQSKDTGIKRRFNVMKLRGVYTKDEEKDVKAEITRGAYNPELFWLFRVFFSRYLSKLPVSWTRIHPRPPRLVAETNALFDTTLRDEVKDWIEEHTSAIILAKASSAVDVKQALARVFKLDYQHGRNDRDFSELLKTFGLENANSGLHRVLSYTYPDMTRRKGVKLNSELRGDPDRDGDHLQDSYLIFLFQIS